MINSDTIYPNVCPFSSIHTNEKLVLTIIMSTTLYKYMPTIALINRKIRNIKSIRFYRFTAIYCSFDDKFSQPGRQPGSFCTHL